MSRLAAILVCAGLLTTTVHADFETAKADFEAGDYANALFELRPLADRGHLEAQNILGIMHAEGRGVAKDLFEAADWFRQAAEGGLTNAQFNLGISYSKGLGVPLDRVEAHMWLNLASLSIHEAGTLRDRLAKKMSDEEIVEALRRARAWKPRRE